MSLLMTGLLHVLKEVRGFLGDKTLVRGHHNWTIGSPGLRHYPSYGRAYPYAGQSAPTSDSPPCCTGTEAPILHHLLRNIISANLATLLAMKMAAKSSELTSF